MIADYLRLLFDYNYWANRRIWECVIQLTETQFLGQINYSQGSIQSQLVHVIGAESLWFSRLRGTSPTAMLNPADYPSRLAIRHKWDAVEGEARAYLATLTDEQAGQMLNYQRLKGQPEREPIGHILLHLINHGTDHRAQILAVMNEVGGPTVDQDLIVYLRGIKA